MISFCAEALNQQILQEIRDAKFYSILAVEVKDCSNREQMPVIIRFVDKCGEIQERFIKFIHCDTGLTGNALKDKIVDLISNELQLNLTNCRGQCYDGAGNMAGKFSGLSSRILALNPLALYTVRLTQAESLCCLILSNFFIVFFIIYVKWCIRVNSLYYFYCHSFRLFSLKTEESSQNLYLCTKPHPCFLLPRPLCDSPFFFSVRPCIYIHTC